MKVYDRLIRVSKKSILEKLFDVDPAKLSRTERKKLETHLPTEEEAEFMAVYRSTAPQLARLQRKMSVCLDVEVTELSDDRIAFEYGASVYTLTEPPDAWRMCAALDKSVLAGLEEMAAQGCVLKDGVPVPVKNGPLKIDEIRLIEKIADKFFFRIFSE